MGKSKYDINYNDTQKKLYLTGVYPKDNDPNVAQLQFPYKNGIIATLDDIKNALNGNLPGLGSTNNTNLVTTDTVQEVSGNKNFRGKLESLQDPVTDFQVVNKKNLDGRFVSFKEQLDTELTNFKNGITSSITTINSNITTIDASITTINTNLTNLDNKINNLIGDLDSLDIEDPEKKQSVVEAINHIISLINNIGTSAETVDLLYTNLNPVPVTLGGVKQGTRFDNMTIQAVLDLLLYPYQKPAITTLQANPFEYTIGQSTEAFLNVNYTVTNTDNVKENGISFTLDGNELTGTDIPKTGSYRFTITPIRRTEQGNVPVVLKVVASNDEEIFKTTNLVWNNQIYYGINTNTTLDSDTAKTLNVFRANSLNRTYNFGQGGYKYVLYPASWGEKDLKKFINPENNFIVAMEKLNNITIENEYGVSQEYLVYKSVNILNGSIKIRID